MGIQRAKILYYLIVGRYIHLFQPFHRNLEPPEHPPELMVLINIGRNGVAKFVGHFLGFNIKFLIVFQYKKQEWAKTIVEYETDKPGRLPLLDVAVRDVGRPQQMFKIELGLACFK